MVERFFRDSTVDTIGGGVFRNVGDVNRATKEHICHHIQKSKLSVYTTISVGILEKVDLVREKLVQMQSVYRAALRVPNWRPNALHDC
jgi:hypothetical protein